MDQLSGDLQGVAVYLDDILVSGATADDRLQNLCSLRWPLRDKRLRCNLRIYAHLPSHEWGIYLGHTMSRDDIINERKADAIRGTQARKPVKFQRRKHSKLVRKMTYVLYCRFMRNKQPRWVPAVVTSFGLPHRERPCQPKETCVESARGSFETTLRKGARPGLGVEKHLHNIQSRATYMYHIKKAGMDVYFHTGQGLRPVDKCNTQRRQAQQAKPIYWTTLYDRSDFQGSGQLI